MPVATTCIHSIASACSEGTLCGITCPWHHTWGLQQLCAVWQVPTLLARAAGLREDLLNNGLSGHQHRAASRAVAGLKVGSLLCTSLTVSHSVRLHIST